MVFKTLAILTLLAVGASAQGILNSLPEIISQAVASKHSSTANQIDCIVRFPCHLDSYLQIDCVFFQCKFRSQ